MYVNSIVRTPIRLAVTASIAALVTGLVGCTTSNTMGSMPSMDHGSPSPAATTSAGTRASSTPGTPAAGPHNSADIMFAMMMIPHHQQAIEMSELILAKDGIDQRVTDLAGKIKAAQAPEIAQMSGWLAGWGQNPSPSMGMDHDMGGMMSQADMAALEQASGTEAAKLFLTGMVEHHQGAITMAENQVADGENPDAVALAKKIISDQQREIATMNQLLQRL